MSDSKLTEFVESLADAGELIRIGAPVDADLEIAHITARVAGAGGPALLFGNVVDTQGAVVTNLLATHARICRALDVDAAEEVSERLFSPQSSGPRGWMDRLSLAGSGAERFRPKTVRAAACQQVVRLGSDVDLESLPLVRCGAAEPAASMTGGIVVSEASGGAFMRLSRIDALLAGANRLLLAIGLQHELRADIEAARNRGEPFSLAIVLGGHPARMLAAEMPLGAGVDGLIMAGHLENRPLSIVPCRTHALPVPADAEWIVEGVIGPDAPLEDAGPLVGCCGHYYTCPDAPVMHVTALTHRANPLLPAMVPGLPPTEHDAVRAFLGRILLPAVRAAIPAVVDYHWPTGAAGAQTLFVSMRKRYARHARQIAAALWGHPLFATTKLTVLVDDSVDVRDTLAVLRAVGSGTLPGRDTFFHVGPADVAEPAAEEPGLGHAMAIDATAKPRREHPRPWPQAVLPDKDVAARVESRWKQLGLDGGS